MQLRSEYPNLILTGFMGTGKSTLGRMLAQNWRWDFLDTDKIIQQKTKRSISEIFATDGEPAFRELEKQCVAEWLPAGGTIISTGGGIVTIPGMIEQLRRHGIVFALFASPETIFERIKTNKSRPLVQTENPLESLRTLLAEREHFYMNSGINVLTEHRTLPEIAQTVERAYRKELRKMNTPKTL